MSPDEISRFLTEKRFDFTEFEPRIRQYWDEIRAYDHNPGAGLPILIDTPPPYANGRLHHGHGMSYTQLDIIARYHRMRAPTLLPLAFDDNGLPTERHTERKYGIEPGMHPPDFFELCEQESLESIAYQLRQFQALGFSYNHRVSYRTMDERAMKITQQDFIDLYHRGHLDYRTQPQIHCPNCQTSLSQADLMTQQREAILYHIKFDCEGDIPIEIATTRPGLIPAAVAIFYHPHHPQAHTLRGIQAINPITGEKLPILEDDSIDPSFGSGIMMCSTFGDQADIQLFRKHDLPLKIIIDGKGCFNSVIPSLKSLSIEQGKSIILQDLGDHLIATEKMKQSYPTCERCSSPIEIIMSRQWSIRILEQKEQLLEFIQPLQIHPSFMKKRLINWISGLSWDWIISRQRQYGIAIPAWICDTCESIKIADTSQLPIRLDEMTSESCHQSNCQGELQPDGDIFDTWMTSSLSPVILNELYSLSGPMSFRSQAHEIIRTWAFYTIVKGLLKGENLPWDHLLISGWGLGFKEKGKRGIKASKSSGSGFDPLDIIAEIGADPFRYWCASARLGKDQYLNEAILNRGKKLTTKLYNATKIILLLADNSQGPETEPPAESRLQEILHRMEILQGRYEGCMSEFEYSDALTAAELDFWNEFCQVDIEFFKSNSLGDMWNNLFEIHLMYLRMFAPFLPFITEYLYQIMAEYLSAKGTNSTLAPSIHMRY